MRFGAAASAGGPETTISLSPMPGRTIANTRTRKRFVIVIEMRLPLVDRQETVIQGEGKQRSGRAKYRAHIAAPASVILLRLAKAFDVLLIPAFPCGGRSAKKRLRRVIEVVLKVVLIPRVARIPQIMERRLEWRALLLFRESQN